MISGDFFMASLPLFYLLPWHIYLLLPETKTIPGFPHFPLRIIYILLCPFLMLPNPIMASFYYSEVRSYIHMCLELGISQ